ncbi:hypothetical protein Agub_g9481, partial [Astrephomene gubernaculifera]
SECCTLVSELQRLQHRGCQPLTLRRKRSSSGSGLAGASAGLVEWQLLGVWPPGGTASVCAGGGSTGSSVAVVARGSAAAAQRAESTGGEGSGGEAWGLDDEDLQAEVEQHLRDLEACLSPPSTSSPPAATEQPRDKPLPPPTLTPPAERASYEPLQQPHSRPAAP